MARATVARQRRALAVRRQFEHALPSAQPRHPVLQLALAFAGFQPVSLPDRIVRILDRQIGQRRLDALPARAVQGNEFLHQYPHGPAVGCHMVDGQGQHVIVGRQAQQARAKQRTVTQIEGLLRLAFNESANLRLRVVVARQRNRDGYVDRRQHLLAEAIQLFVLDEHGAQALVAFDDGAQAGGQRLDVQFATQAQRRGNVVGGALRVHLPEEPLALLGIGQRDTLEGRGHLGNRQVGRRHALLLHLRQVQLALVERKRDEAPGNPQSYAHVHSNFLHFIKQGFQLVQFRCVDLPTGLFQIADEKPQGRELEQQLGVSFMPSSS